MRTVVAKEDEGMRLDAFLLVFLRGVTRGEVVRLIDEGSVRVNGRRTAKGDRLRAGDEVTVTQAPRPRDFDPAPDGLSDLTVLHSDADVVVVDKPAGVACHPLRQEEQGTIVQRALARFPDVKGVGRAKREAGLVHRLDTQTSGLLLLARNTRAFDALRADLEAGRIRKSYLALVVGQPARGAIEFPIKNDPADERRVQVIRDSTERGRAATTRVREISVHGAFSLVSVEAARATRHQVRVHLAAVGHPLVGDDLYGGPAFGGLARHFLHAHEMEFRQPQSGALLRFRSGLPPELAAVLDKVRADA